MITDTEIAELRERATPGDPEMLHVLDELERTREALQKIAHEDVIVWNCSDGSQERRPNFAAKIARAALKAAGWKG